MGQYIAKRLLIGAVTLFALATITFFLMHVIPGSPFAGETSKLPASVKEKLVAKYGLDQPLLTQFVTYLGNAVLIAGTDGNGYSPTHADGQVNYIYNNYVNPNSTTHHFNTVYKHNYDCSSQAATIRSEINAGVGLANYTAHGSPSGWADPAFNTSHVSSMTNTNKYGKYDSNTKY